MDQEPTAIDANRRQETRRPVDMRAFAVPQGGAVAEGLISDLSYDGCRLECSPMPGEGEQLELRVMRLGVIQAEVRWARGGRAGCRFIA